MASDLQFYLPAADHRLVPDLTLRRSTKPVDPNWEPEEPDLLARTVDEQRAVRYVVARTPAGYRFRFTDLCDFDISGDLADATWTLAPGGDPGVVAVLASGALMAFRMIMSGHLVLHASAVHTCGRGLAFIGASGMGKSTMASLMCANGAALITDDVARVTINGDNALVTPGAIESRLRPAAIQLTELFTSPTTRHTSDGRIAVTLPRRSDHAVPLDAVIVPVPSREHGTLELTALARAQSLILLNQFPRLPGWVDRTSLSHQFTLLGALVERVPAYVAVIPWGPPFAVETGRQLLDALRWSQPPLADLRKDAATRETSARVSPG
ncbi:MAG: hypothetical protein ACRDSR_01050 [Pseudonocardiaceae bacterium]